MGVGRQDGLAQRAVGVAGAVRRVGRLGGDVNRRVGGGGESGQRQQDEGRLEGTSETTLHDRSPSSPSYRSLTVSRLRAGSRAPARPSCCRARAAFSRVSEYVYGA